MSSIPLLAQAASQPDAGVVYTAAIVFTLLLALALTGALYLPKFLMKKQQSQRAKPTADDLLLIESADSDWLSLTSSAISQISTMSGQTDIPPALWDRLLRSLDKLIRIFPAESAKLSHLRDSLHRYQNDDPALLQAALFELHEWIDQKKRQALM